MSLRYFLSFEPLASKAIKTSLHNFIASGLEGSLRSNSFIAFSETNLNRKKIISLTSILKFTQSKVETAVGFF